MVRVRAVRDKYGSRNYILFFDKDGLDKPLAVVSDVHMQQLVEDYYEEQQAMDKAIVKTPTNSAS